jgi:outer membrane protein assembly factor BamB
MQLVKLSIVVAAITAFCWSTINTPAADWPQWRGPQRTGISSETGLLHDWPTDGPKLIWRSEKADSGYSTPAIIGGRMYLLGNRGMDDEFVKALSTKDGSEIWSVRIGKVGPNIPEANYPGARSTPTVDGDVLFALGSDGNLMCLETAGGKLRWQKDLRSELGGQPGKWAYAESPLVDGDVLVCTPGGADATLAALNKKTGEVIWKSAVPGADEAAYSSITVLGSGSDKQYVQMVQNGLIGVDAKTGKFLWRYEKTAKDSPANIPTPVSDGRLVYSATGRGGGALIKLVGTSDSLAPEEVYNSQKLPNAIGGSVKIGDYLYGTSSQGLRCIVFATGEEKWSDRCIGAASICYADRNLYLHGENGDLALVEATPDGYHEKGKFTPPDQPDRGPGKAWAYPVVANGRLYIRDQQVVWCYDIKASPGSP